MVGPMNNCLVATLLVLMLQMRLPGVEAITGDRPQDVGSVWKWDDEHASAAYSLRYLNWGAGGSPIHCELEAIPGKPGITFSVSLDGKTHYSWQGHRYSVFRAINNKLYFIDWNPKSTGGEMVAVDLYTAREIWRTPIKGLLFKKPTLSEYLNRFSLSISDNKVVILGKENYGYYTEVKNLATGNTIEYKILSRDERSISQ